VFLPVVLPTFIWLVLLRLSISSHKSRNRLKILEADASNKERLIHVISKLEIGMENVVVNLYDSDSTPTPSSPISISDSESANCSSQELVVDDSLSTTSKSKAEGPPPFQPLLTPVQLRCIENLNKIPQLKKECAFFTGVRNSHAMVVCRDPKKFKFHLEGEGLLRHWADQFEL
jgi:hypothetical protein